MALSSNKEKQTNISFTKCIQSAGEALPNQSVDFVTSKDLAKTQKNTIQYPEAQREDKTKKSTTYVHLYI